MNDGLIPQRYAKALYKYALEHQATGRLYGEMKAEISAFEANPELVKVVHNPFVSGADKERLLLAAAGPEPSDELKAFIQLMLAHKREPFFPAAARAYLEIYRRENKIKLVTITTAQQLDESETDKIKKLVEKAYKGYTLEFRVKVDPAIIGGFMIDADSSRLDASLRNEIEQLRQKLLRK